MRRDFTLDHGQARYARFRAAVFGPRGQGAEFIEWVCHSDHLNPCRCDHASEKQKQAGFEQERLRSRRRRWLLWWLNSVTVEQPMSVIAMLLSEEEHWINAQTIEVAGGYNISIARLAHA
jgi:hypothetical protein